MEKGVNPTGGRGRKTTFWRVLKYLASGYPRKYILKALNISSRRFYTIRKQLIEKGFLDATGFCTEKGRQKGSQVVYAGSAIGGSVSTGTFVRLHRIQISIPIFRWWKKPENKEMVRFGRGGSASYWKCKVNDASVQVFPRSLTVYLPPFFGNDQAECDRKFLAWFLEWVPIAEEIIGCRCSRPGASVPWRIVRREYAKVGAKNAQLHVIRDDYVRVRDESGKLRYIVDQSQGPEFEAVHSQQSRADFQKFEVFYNDVRTGRYDALRSGVSDLGATVVDLTKTTAAVVKVMRERGLFDD